MQQKTNSYVFEYTPLGLNLERNVEGDQEERKKETIVGKITKEPERIMAGEDLAMVNFTLIYYTSHGVPPQTETNYIKCFVPATLDIGLKVDDIITVTGFVAEKHGGFGENKRVYRSLDVFELSLGQPTKESSNPSSESEITEPLPF